MPDKQSRAGDTTGFGSASIEQLLEAEKAVETRLAEAREVARQIVADAYDAAQSVDRQTDNRIAKMAREASRENDERAGAIIAEAEAIDDMPVDTQPMRTAVRSAADALAAKLTGSDR